jgi:hypothetical protein
MTETPLGVDIDRPKAENDKLREALEKSKATMNIMANKAHEVGLEGSIEWDKVAGTADLYGCLRLVSAALAAERERCAEECVKLVPRRRETP